MNHFKKNRILSFSVLGLVLCLIFWAGYRHGSSVVQKYEHRDSDCHRMLSLLDQTLDCEKVENAQTRTSSLEEKVNTFVDVTVKDKKVKRVAVFYRDLSTRRWFGVNSDAEFYPASLAKLPLAVAYYKVADLEPTLFDQAILLAPAKEYSNEGQRVSVDSPMVVGGSYSIRRMVEDMLVYSDNRSIGPLLSFIRPDVWKKVYADLGVRKQTDMGEEDWSVTPRAVSLIFRSLYNGSYLDLESSQELLSVMSKAKYARGLVAGVPSGVLVAHKFGEATMVEDGGVLTPVLHDCGIVYKAEEPYILCIMTEGKEFTDLEKTIAEISRLVYESQ